MGKLIPLVIIAVPLIEIAGFVLVGHILGVAGTLALVVLSTAWGLTLVRRQGFSTLIRLQEVVARRQTPVQPLFEGLCLGLAGALFIIPGFFTDLVALGLLIPALRRRLFRLIGRRVTIRGDDDGPDPGATVINGEFQEIAGEIEPPGQSRWRPPGSPFRP
ncbi:MAG: FxsA family protein [Azospirillaceae bacterium]|nr:FxsA family protein [Azospirillaceae bacterium]